MTFEESLKVAELVKWPITFFLLAIFFLLILRGSFESLIVRVKRAAVGDKTVDFTESAAIASEQQQQKKFEKQPTLDASSAELPPPPASPAIASIEASISATLSVSTASTEVKQAWIVRNLAVARIERAHEITYRLIMGSQIALLLHANTGVPVEMSVARSIYDDAKAAYPEIYKAFEFQNWLVWPANSGLTTLEQVVDRMVVQITDIGKEFLHYLVTAGLTLPKIG